METIRKFIEQLFTESNYKKVTISELDIFLHQKYSDYWIIMDSFHLEDQSELFDRLIPLQKKFIDIEKNTSILVLNEIKSTETINLSQCIEMENDSLYFKKNVLSYTQENFKKLLLFIKGKNFSDILFDENFFEQLEMNISPMNEYTLAYSIAQKLPFLKMNVKQKNYECESFFEQLNTEEKQFIETIYNLKNEDEITEYIKRFVFGE